MSVNLKALIGKLNASARKALEDAAGLCVSRTHFKPFLHVFHQHFAGVAAGVG